MQSFNSKEIRDIRCGITAYISVFDGKLDIISSLQGFQITLEFAVVKEDFLHNIGPLDEPKCLLKDNSFHGLYENELEICTLFTEKTSKF